MAASRRQRSTPTNNSNSPAGQRSNARRSIVCPSPRLVGEQSVRLIWPAASLTQARGSELFIERGRCWQSASRPAANLASCTRDCASLGSSGNLHSGPAVSAAAVRMSVISDAPTLGAQSRERRCDARGPRRTWSMRLMPVRFMRRFIIGATTTNVVVANSPLRRGTTMWPIRSNFSRPRRRSPTHTDSLCTRRARMGPSGRL